MTGERAESKRFLKRIYPFAYAGYLDRGKDNESRALSLFQEMVAEGIFSSVRKASKRQNTQGVDLWGVVTSQAQDGVIPQETQIPFQIKSSPRGAAEFRRLAKRDKKRSRVVTIVVNRHKTDQQIESEVRQKVAEYLRTRTEQSSLI